jgi:hypothetical protein
MNNLYPHKDVCGWCRENILFAEVNPQTNVLRFCKAAKDYQRSMDLPVLENCPKKEELKKYKHIERPVKHSLNICRKCLLENGSDEIEIERSFKNFIVPCVNAIKATSICNDVHPKCPYQLEHFMEIHNEPSL